MTRRDVDTLEVLGWICIGILVAFIGLNVSSCGEIDDAELLGCIESAETGGEICAWCDDGLVDVTGLEFDSPLALCQDFCNSSSTGRCMPGCQKYVVGVVDPGRCEHLDFVE